MALTCHVDILVLQLGIDFSQVERVITRLIKQRKNQEKKGPESKQRVDKTTLFPKIEKSGFRHVARVLLLWCGGWWEDEGSRIVSASTMPHIDGHSPRKGNTILYNVYRTIEEMGAFPYI